jgi:hypothetical protein
MISEEDVREIWAIPTIKSLIERENEKKKENREKENKEKNRRKMFFMLKEKRM